MWEAKLPQSALRQQCWAFCCAAFEGRERVALRELWSEVVSWSIASVRTSCVVLPLERHRSMVEGCPPFRGWWVGVAILLWRWKLFSVSQLAMVWLAGEVCADGGSGPCHHVWCALRSPIRRQSVGRLMVGRMAATGFGCPGEYRLYRLNVVVCCCCRDVMVVPRKESWAIKVVVALSPGTWRTYVAHLGRVGVGVNMSKFGIVGGFPSLSHHGSWRRQIRFSGFLANSCNAEIVVTWPFAQFSSCMDPTVWEGILFGHSRHGGVSWGGRGHRIRVVVKGSDLDACGAVGVAGLVGCVAIGAADWWVGAGGASLAGRDGAWVVFRFVGVRTDGAVGWLFAQGGGVSIALAVPTLGASSVLDVVVKLAFAVADGEVVSFNVSLLVLPLRVMTIVEVTFCSYRSAGLSQRGVWHWISWG